MNDNNSLKKQSPEICRKAAIHYGRKVEAGLTFHDIRRTFKTNMVTVGVDKVCRNVILGHRLTCIEAHYIVLTDEVLKKAMDQYTAWFDSRFQIVPKNKVKHFFKIINMDLTSGNKGFKRYCMLKMLYYREFSRLNQCKALAEVHGNRTHPGRF